MALSQVKVTMACTHILIKPMLCVVESVFSEMKILRQVKLCLLGVVMVEQNIQYQWGSVSMNPNSFRYFFFFFFLGPPLKHMEVPRVGVESELHLGPTPQLAAMLDP